MKPNNKNKFYNQFSFSCYRYAPESFQLSYNGNRINLTHEERHDMGYAYICKGKEELKKMIKQWVRKKSCFKQTVSKKFLAIISKDMKNYYFIRFPVERFNIQETLYSFKNLKQAIQNKQFQINITTMELDENYKPQNIRKKSSEVELSNKIVFVTG